MKVECPYCHKKFELKFKCQRCGHEWTPRSSDLPKNCPNPKCKSPYWNKPIERHSVSESRKKK